MNQLFTILSAYYWHSTLVTLITALGEIYYLRRQVMKLAKINGLITACQHRILARAARILVNSDAHDQLFFEMCKSISGTQGDVVKLSNNISLVRTHEAAATEIVTITERGDRIHGC